jgi:coproporphyrinogen III oxidase-like Fe-S oxidoreductase
LFTNARLVLAYLGLGASSASYLRDIFYLNTFNVAEYIRALGVKHAQCRSAIVGCQHLEIGLLR